MSQLMPKSGFNTSTKLICQTDNQRNQLRKPACMLMIGVLSFTAVGCSALNALEPTAVLISDIKGSI